MGKQQTVKKVKVIGTQTYINANTGEIEEMQVTSIENRDFNFHKVWLTNLISSLEVVGNAKIKLCFWIIDHVNKENQLCYTYRGIAEESGYSLDTVKKTMKLLLNADFLRKPSGSSVYIMNPDIVYKGSRTSRLNILNQYNYTERKQITSSEKIANLKNSIESLQKQLDIMLSEEKSQEITKEVS